MKALQEAHTQKLRQADTPVFLVELLESVFPKLHEAMGNTAWRELIKQFFREHPIKTPIMHEISDEFVEYLYHFSNKNWFELAHFEWVELALYFDTTDLSVISINKNSFVVSPLAYLLNYPTFEQIHWIAWRNRAHQVSYIPITLFEAKTFEALKEFSKTKKNTTLSAQAVIKQLALAPDHPSSGELEKLLDDWRAKDIILG